MKKVSDVSRNSKLVTYILKSAHPVSKIHIHDAKPSEAYGIFDNGRLLCLYTYESDLSDGWEDSEVHNDSEETRLKALKMGSNIIEYVFLGKN